MTGQFAMGGTGVATGGGVVTAPTGITLSNLSIYDNIAVGGIVGMLGMVGGTAPPVFTVTDNPKFAASGSNLVRTASGGLTIGVSETVTIHCDDANSLSPSDQAFSIAILDHTAANVLTTLTIDNTGVGTQSAFFLTQFIGHPFKKGDVPAGTFPQFRLTDGTAVPFTYWNKVTWSDGSWKFAGFVLRPPVAIAGSGSLTVNVLSGGTSPGTSGRTLAEVAAAAIQVIGVGEKNLSGTWTADLANAISSARETVVIGDGACGKMWRVLGDFKQSGSAHGQLECYFYVMAMQDRFGALAGIRCLPMVVNCPWFNYTAAAKHQIIFSSLSLVWTGGSLNPTTVAYAAHAGVYSGSGDTITASVADWHRGVPVKYTASVAAMTGLTSGTTYWAWPDPGSASCKLTDRSISPLSSGNYVAVTGAGSGTHTFTPMNYANVFGGQWMAQSTGKYPYIQGGGSIASESTTRVRFNTAYWVSSKVVPPIRQDLGAITSAGTYNWAPQAIGPLSEFIGTTGERGDIGVINSWQCRHLLTQLAVDELVVRTIGLSQINIGTCIRDLATLAPIHLGSPARSYTGMGSSQAVPFQHANGSEFGWTPPADTNECLPQVFNQNTTDHMTNYSYYYYLMTGQPEGLDLLVGLAANGLWSYPPDNRNLDPGAGTTYYGINFASRDSLRAGAWGGAFSNCVAGIYPDVSPDGKGLKAYHVDIATDQAAYMVAWFNQCNSWMKAAGFWFPQNCNNGRGSWQLNYTIYATCLGYGLLELADYATILGKFALWPEYVRTHFGIWHLSSYYERSGKGGNGEQGAAGGFIDSDVEWGPEATINFNWASATDILSWNSPIWTPSNGDKFIFGAEGSTAPGGLSLLVPYYAVNTSGNNQKLAASPGGSALNITDDLSNVGGGDMFIIVANPPATGMISGVSGGTLLDPTGYAANCNGAYSYIKALGITVSASVLSEFDSRFVSSITNYGADPKYAMARTY